MTPSLDPGVSLYGDGDGEHEVSLPTAGNMGLSAQFLTSDSGSIEINIGRKKDVQALQTHEDSGFERMGLVTRSRSGNSQKWSTFVFALNRRSYDLFRGESLDPVNVSEWMISPAIVVGNFPRSKMSVEFLIGMTVFVSTFDDPDQEEAFNPDETETTSDRMELRLPIGFKTAYEVQENLHLIAETTITPSTGAMGDVSVVIPVNAALGVRYIHNEFVLGAAYFSNVRNPVHDGEVRLGWSHLMDLEASGLMLNAGYAWY